MRASSVQVSYAIGDIHGRLDLFDIALDLIQRHARGLDARIILLGDLVDRGPDSREAVERAMSLDRDGAAVCLKGNHEAMMVDGLAHWPGPESMLWFAQGGRQTLSSYGAGDTNTNTGGRVPQAHKRWLADRPTALRERHCIYVHAGVAPGVSFRKQKDKDLLWIREAFLRAPAESLEVHVVHGHTPIWADKPDPAQPELLAHRTNLDTGAYASGILTVGVFDGTAPGGPVQILTAQGASTGAMVDATAVSWGSSAR